MLKGGGTESVRLNIMDVEYMLAKELISFPPLVHQCPAMDLEMRCVYRV